jgi:hypothetical protein
VSERRSGCGVVRKQYRFIIKLCHLTNVFLDACLNISLRFIHVEAITIRHITRDLVYAYGGLACKAFPAIGTFSIDFILPWAIARMWTKVCICNPPNNFLLEIPK